MIGFICVFFLVQEWEGGLGKVLELDSEVGGNSYVCGDFGCL